MKVDTERGYISKPKRRKGYTIDSYYCECGCKRGYWHYVKIKIKNQNQMKSITVKGELLFTLTSKQDWVRRVPKILPEKIRGGETWIWIDKNGNVFECGRDFEAAEEMNTYPCKVYRLSNVAGCSPISDGEAKNK